MVQRQLGKGERAEEALRGYFLSLGYFVVRSIPFNYRGFDVTDIDLWLYLKSSSLTRERICVDVKSKRTPQALERVFWAKGLQEVLALDRAIVVTTDNRKETRDFGASHNVPVFPGEFLQRVINGFGADNSRVTEEKFIDELKTACILDGNVSWPRFYRESKALLLSSLNFNGCNLLLKKISFLLEECIVSNRSSIACVRLLYTLTSYFLLTVDYSSRLLTHLDPNLRKASYDEGFRYGDAGQRRADEIVNTALQLLSDTSGTDIFSSTRLKEEITNQLSEYPAEMLAEYFSKSETLKHLFSAASELERLAYATTVIMPHELPSASKAFLGLMCDFLKIDRRKVI